MPTAQKTFLCRYHYDPLDRLVDCSPINQANLQRFYCKSRLACEIQGTTQTSIFQHDEQLLAEQRRHGSNLDAHLLATDAHRSVLQSLSPGQRQSSTYAPYGHRTAGNGVLSLLGFNGERAEAVTGHYLLGNGYRAFNPVLMRFNSPDSWSPFGKAGPNGYAYCRADPLNFTDPSGHLPLAKLFRRLLNSIGNSSGTQYKSVKNYTALTHDVHIFKDTYKNAERLNIKAHGGPPLNGKYPFVGINGERASPKELHELLLKNKIIPEKFENIRILACHSATGGQSSFGHQFNALTGRPVKAFHGSLAANNRIQKNKFTIGVIDDEIKEIFIIKKPNQEFNTEYSPEIFSQQIRKRL